MVTGKDILARCIEAGFDFGNGGCCDSQNECCKVCVDYDLSFNLNDEAEEIDRQLQEKGYFNKAECEGQMEDMTQVFNFIRNLVNEAYEEEFDETQQAAAFYSICDEIQRYNVRWDK